jgi:hypothetical protein
MGLNIGIKVKKQQDGWGSEGRNPKGSIDDIEKYFSDFLYKKFPLGGFGNISVSYDKESEEYCFDVRMFKYSSEFDENYPDANIYLAITEYIYHEFSHIEGIKLKTYWSG